MARNTGGFDEMVAPEQDAAYAAPCARCGERAGQHVVSGGYAVCTDGKRMRSSFTPWTPAERRAYVQDMNARFHELLRQ